MKDRRKIIVQQEQTSQNNGWSKQNTQNKNSNRKELYRQVANHLSSQQFQSGVFKKSDITFHDVSKKRHSSILQVEYEQDSYQQKPISIYGQGNLSSNITDNYTESIFQSRLHETKGELSQQIVDLQKRMKRQIQRDRNLIEDYLNRLFNKYTQKSKQDQRKNFDIIVNQLNKNLTITSKKQKVCESGLTETQQKLMELQKQFNQFTLQTQEKLEKLMNTNTDVASSMKKSFSRNVGNGEYMIDLKNSIKDIPVINNNLVEQIKAQIHETQEALKNLKYDIMYVKEGLKTKSLVPIQLQNSKPEMVQTTKLNYLQEQINMLKTQIQTLQSQQQSKQKYKQLRNILQIQQQNYFGMNETFQKTINANIFPKLKKLQQQVQKNAIQRNVQYLKKQVVKQLQSIPIIRIKHLTQQQKQKLQRMKQLPKTQQQVYMLDQFKNIMDSFGNYLLDQNNQRIKLQEDQVYYLEHMEGIQIKMPALQVK